jgi:hypothetical protein
LLLRDLMLKPVLVEVSDQLPHIKKYIV